MYGKTRPNSCNVKVKNELEFELYLGFNDIDCDVSQERAGRFTSDVIIQHHEMIVTSQDVGLKIRCNYNLSNRTVTNTANLAVTGGLNQAGAENTVVKSPNVTLRVTDRNGGDISSAQVGDPLALRFEILEDNSPYEIFVRELIAMDGLDSSEILLIDSLGKFAWKISSLFAGLEELFRSLMCYCSVSGCPTDYSILGVLSEVNNTGQILQAAFDAFKFPTSDVVQFRALVTPCIPRCDPVRCDLTDYYGRSNTLKSYGRRRKKRSSSSPSSATDGEDNELMVAGVIHISDKFELEDSGELDKPGNEGNLKKKQDTNRGQGGGGAGTRHSGGEDVWTRYNRDSCLNTSSFAIGATLFLVAQCLLVGFWTFLYYKKKREKEEEVSCSMSESVLQEQFHQRRPRTPTMKPMRHQRVMSTAASSTDSGLADYDPYFVDPFDIPPGVGVVSFDDSGLAGQHQCPQGVEAGPRYQQRRQKHSNRHHRRKLGHNSSSMDEDMSSAESSLSSLDPRNL